MKRFYLLSLLSFLFSSATFAQTPTLPGDIVFTMGTVVSPNLKCLGDEMELEIDVIWDADLALLQGMASSINDVVPANLPPLFHLVTMNFTGTGSNFIAAVDSQNIDIRIRQFESFPQLPIVVFFQAGIHFSGYKVIGRYDANGYFLGYTVKNTSASNDDANGDDLISNNGPISSVAAVAIRDTYTQLPLGRRIEVTRTNNQIFYQTALHCTIPNEIVSTYRSISSNKEIQSELEATSVNAYPNPAKHTLFLATSDQSEIQEINISNLFGQNVDHKVNTRYAVDEAQINTSRLEAGIYLLQITTSTDNTILKKITIQR